MRALPVFVACWVGLVLAASSGLAAPPAAKRPPEFNRPDTLSPGDDAPNFTLASPDGKQKVELHSFRGQKPVALIFGSYT